MFVHCRGVGAGVGDFVGNFVGAAVGFIVGACDGVAVVILHWCVEDSSFKSSW